MSAARDTIRALFARWERLQDEKKAISDDLAELFKEAKGQTAAVSSVEDYPEIPDFLRRKQVEAA